MEPSQMYRCAVPPVVLDFFASDWKWDTNGCRRPAVLMTCMCQNSKLEMLHWELKISILPATIESTRRTFNKVSVMSLSYYAVILWPKVSQRALDRRRRTYNTICEPRSICRWCRMILLAAKSWKFYEWCQIFGYVLGVYRISRKWKVCNLVSWKIDE